MDESKLLEEIRNWEHPLWYGIVQFKERVTLTFLENQKGLFHNFMDSFPVAGEAMNDFWSMSGSFIYYKENISRYSNSRTKWLRKSIWLQVQHLDDQRGQWQQWQDAHQHARGLSTLARCLGCLAILTDTSHSTWIKAVHASFTLILTPCTCAVVLELLFFFFTSPCCSPSSCRLSSPYTSTPTLTPWKTCATPSTGPSSTWTITSHLQVMSPTPWSSPTSRSSTTRSPAISSTSRIPSSTLPLRQTTTWMMTFGKLIAEVHRDYADYRCPEGVFVSPSSMFVASDRTGKPVAKSNIDQFSCGVSNAYSVRN